MEAPLVMNRMERRRLALLYVGYPAVSGFAMKSIALTVIQPFWLQHGLEKHLLGVWLALNNGFRFAAVILAPSRRALLGLSWLATGLVAMGTVLLAASTNAVWLLAATGATDPSAAMLARLHDEGLAAKVFDKYAQTAHSAFAMGAILAAAGDVAAEAAGIHVVTTAALLSCAAASLFHAYFQSAPRRGQTIGPEPLSPRERYRRQLRGEAPEVLDSSGRMVRLERGGAEVETDSSELVVALQDDDLAVQGSQMLWLSVWIMIGCGLADGVVFSVGALYFSDALGLPAWRYGLVSVAMILGVVALGPLFPRLGLAFTPKNSVVAFAVAAAASATLVCYPKSSLLASLAYPLILPALDVPVRVTARIVDSYTNLPRAPTGGGTDFDRSVSKMRIGYMLGGVVASVLAPLLYFATSPKFLFLLLCFLCLIFAAAASTAFMSNAVRIGAVQFERLVELELQLEKTCDLEETNAVPVKRTDSFIDLVRQVSHAEDSLQRRAKAIFRRLLAGGAVSSESPA